MRKRFPLGGKSRDFDSRQSRESVINCYIDADSTGSFKRLTRIPGFTDFIELGNGPIRAMHVAAGKLYVISGSDFYRLTVNPVGSVTSELIGTVAGFTGQATIASIGTDEPQVMALTDGRGFLYKNSDGSFTEVTDIDFDPDFSVTGFNQRFWFNKPNSNEFFASEILDGLTYDPLFFASAENKPDLSQYAIALNTELYIFGESTIERWQDTGITDDFPLRRITGSTIYRGLGAQASVTQWENNIFFLADDFTVRKIGGGGYEKISDLAFEEAVRDYSFPERAYGYMLDNPHHKVFCLNFPGDNVTWSYDVSTGFWHQRDSFVDDAPSGWRISNAALIFDKVILGDRYNGKLYTMDEKAYDEAGVETPMIWQTPPIRWEEAPMTISEVELFCEVGVGLIDDVNELGIKEPDTLDPKIRMKWSKDGGQTFTGQKDRSLGRIGEYGKKVRWRNIGRLKRGQDLVFEFSINDPVKAQIYSGYVDGDVGV